MEISIPTQALLLGFLLVVVLVLVRAALDIFHHRIAARESAEQGRRWEHLVAHTAAVLAPLFAPACSSTPPTNAWAQPGSMPD